MISFEEAGRILDEAAEALPEEIFRGLNGGVNLIPQVRRDENGLLVMGTYNGDQMGRRVEIYYGSFRVRYPDASPDKCAKALVRTLKHELRHHIENLAMDRSLERWDEQHVAELLSGLYDIEPLEVRSLLFADDEASGVAEMACSMFQSAAKGVGIDVVSGCACNEVGAISIRAARASLDRYGVRATACGRPVPLTRELCEQYDLVMCMTDALALELCARWPELEDRICCLGAVDYTAPRLETQMGWNRVADGIAGEINQLIAEPTEAEDDDD